VSIDSYSRVEKLQSWQRKQGRENKINFPIEGMLVLSLVLLMGLDPFSLSVRISIPFKNQTETPEMHWFLTLKLFKTKCGFSAVPFNLLSVCPN